MAGLPDRTGHKDFGAVAAAWGMLEDLGVAGIIDEAAGPRPAGQPLCPCEGIQHGRFLSRCGYVATPSMKETAVLHSEVAHMRGQHRYTWIWPEIRLKPKLGAAATWASTASGDESAL